MANQRVLYLSWNVGAIWVLFGVSDLVNHLRRSSLRCQGGTQGLLWSK